MIAINKIDSVTYPLNKINDTAYLIGVCGNYELRNWFDDTLVLNTNLNECGFSIIKEKVFFVSHSSIWLFEQDSNALSLFYKSDKENEIWFFNEQFIFEAKRTEIRREYEYSLIDTLGKMVLWAEKSMNRPSVASTETLFFTDILGSVFSKKDIKNGVVEWSIDFSKNRISGKVIAINKVLVFTTTNQDLIGIEIETGKELWRLSNCNLYHQQQPNTNYLVGLSANSFGDNFYQLIDPINGKKIVDKKFENFFYETTPNKSCITATHYYFISNVLGDGTGTRSERHTHLGCINLQTHEIEWIEKVGTTSDRRSEYQKPEINNNKIYLLDGEQTLHIYELQ